MYNVYINHFKTSSGIVNTDTLMFSIPSAGGFPVTKPIVKSTEDSADNFSFSMESSSPYYDALLQFKTTIRVEYEGDIIFWGRVLTVGTSTVFQTKNVICEGTFAYFNDTYYEGVQEKNRTDIQLSAYYDKIIANHNANTTADKVINKGTVGVTLPTDPYKYEPTAWTETSSLISSMANNYGGHMRIRYSGSTAYLDWYKYYARDLGNGNRPVVRVAKNIIEISSEQNVDNIFTRIIPIGDTNTDGVAIYIDGYTYTDKNGVSHTHSGKSFPVSKICDLYTDGQLTDDFHDADDYRHAEDNYGVIYKTMTFTDADTQAKLWNYTKNWVKESYFGLVTSFTVKAIDMHIVNGNGPKILLGECVDVEYPIVENGAITWKSKKLICKTIQYDLFNPENNSYTFGVPSELLEHNKSNKKKSAAKEASVAASSSAPRTGGGGHQDEEITWYKIYRMIGTQNSDPRYNGTAAAESFYANGEWSGTFTVYDPEECNNDPINHKDKWFTVQIVGKLTHMGFTKWIGISGDRGIVAFGNFSNPGPVLFWYSKHKGYKYNGEDPGISSFDKVASLVETSANTEEELIQHAYTGSAVATLVRNNGQMSGTVKCRGTNEDGSTYVFTAQVMGSFTKDGATKYVCSSSEYGVFAITVGHAVNHIYPVEFWYSHQKGFVYDNTSGGFFSVEDSSGNQTLFGSSNGLPEGKPAIRLTPTESTGRGSEGTIRLGYDTTAQGDHWRIGLNMPVTYTDKNGQSQTVDGFVTANDFKLNEVQSLKTKIAVIDAAFIGVVYANTIEAEIAYIKNINKSTPLAGTQISAANAYFTNAAVTNISVSSQLNYAISGMGAINLISSIWTSYQFVTSGNTTTLQGRSANGGGTWVNLANFNIADTAAYKNAVSAAASTARDGVYCSGYSSSIDPGSSTTVYLYYNNSSGVPVLLKTGCTITAKSSSGGHTHPVTFVRGNVGPGSNTHYYSAAVSDSITGGAASFKFYY